MINLKIIIRFTLVIGLFFSGSSIYAASCCGGGAAGALILPKFSRVMVEGSFQYEKYNGFYGSDRAYYEDPPASDLNQIRLKAAIALRVSDRFQMALSVPYVWNKNYYSGMNLNSSGMGDSIVSATYETFDDVKCVYKVRTLQDLMPAIYISLVNTIPTGISPYSNVDNSFKITGRGFYQTLISTLIDKTVYPYNFSINGGYGVHYGRPVNREYGVYKKPYEKKLGNRWNLGASAGYTLFMENMDLVTLVVSYDYINEAGARIDGVVDHLADFYKSSIGISLSYTTSDKNRIFKIGYTANPSYAEWGSNSPVTSIISAGVSNVFK